MGRRIYAYVSIGADISRAVNKRSTLHCGPTTRVKKNVFSRCLNRLVVWNCPHNWNETELKHFETVFETVFTPFCFSFISVVRTVWGRLLHAWRCYYSYVAVGWLCPAVWQWQGKVVKTAKRHSLSRMNFSGYAAHVTALDSIAAGTCSRCDEHERRRWRPGRSATQTSWSRYCGDRPFSARNAMTTTL